MASIARRPDGTYRPRYRDEHGKEHARHFKRKVDAQRWQRMLRLASAAMTLDRYADLFVDDLDDVADRVDALRAASREGVADFLRTETPSEGSPEPPVEVNPQVRGVETRGIEPLTPALQRRCSAN